MSEGQSPIHFLRYEDLVADPVSELEGLFKFLLEMDDIEGTNIQRRIKAVTSKD
jgi:hypothetical protein